MSAVDCRVNGESGRGRVLEFTYHREEAGNLPAVSMLVREPPAPEELGLEIESVPKRGRG